MAPKAPAAERSEASKRAGANKRKGSAWETEIVAFLRERGYDAERLHLNGQNDEGDIVVRHDGTYTVIEAKNEQRIDLARYLREAAEERENFRKHRGLDENRVNAVVMVKQRGKGAAHAYVVRAADNVFPAVTL